MSLEKNILEEEGKLERENPGIIVLELLWSLFNIKTKVNKNAWSRT